MTGLRSFLARWGVALAALATALVITGRTHGFFIRPYAVPVSNDEGYITAMALRMVRGHWLPYVDGVSQRGPITYWLCTLVMRMGGMFSWTALRLLALGLAFSIVTLVFLLGLELFSPFAAGIAVLVQAYFFTYELNPWDGVGYNAEIVAMQFVLLSALFIARVQTRPVTPSAGAGRSAGGRARWLVAAGALAACAGLSKQVTLVHIGPSILWLLVGPRETADPPAAVGAGSASGRWLVARRSDLGWYSLGLVAPFMIVLSLYGAAGHLREFLYYYQQYGREIFMAPVTREVMRDKLHEEIDKYSIGIAGVSFLTLFAIARAGRALLCARTPDVGPCYLHGPLGTPRAHARLRANAPSLFVLLHLLVATIGASFTWRFFGHYFVQMYPFVSLAAAYALSEPFERMDEDRLPQVAAGLVVVVGATLLLVIANVSLYRNVLVRRERDPWYQRPGTDAIVRYVRDKTLPSDTIFVWGFRAETYVSSRRYPASRFVYTVYPSGVVPWFAATRAEEESRVVPGSRQLLLRDLEASRPELVIDAGRSMAGRYMYEIPIFRSYLDSRYCFARFVDGEPVYRRRHGEQCSPPDY